MVARAQQTIAVLPFQNLSADPSSDYLKLAVPDEVTTALSYTPALAVRPFSQSQRYATADVDLRQAGRDLRTENVVTGHFRSQSGQIRLTLEVIDVDDNRVLWRDSLEVPAADSLALRQGVEQRIREGLLPALGATPGAAGSQPKNPRAYELFLRALAISRDVAPNRQGIAILEEVVALDPGFAPGWGALAFRYYMDGRYGGGGPEMMARAEAALRRALSLDPGLIEAAREMIAFKAESGQLLESYDAARALLARRPDSAESHFAMAYVMRYAGILEEAARECETARRLDPQNPIHRSCALGLLLQGNYPRALEWIQVDAGSEFATNFIAELHLRQGRPAEALAEWRRLPADDRRRVLAERCLPGGSSTQGAPTIHDMEPELIRQTDPELSYVEAARLAHCGQRELALRFLGAAVAENYCAALAMDSDPLFKGLRSDPEFQRLRGLAQQCQERFLAHRAAAGG